MIAVIFVIILGILWYKILCKTKSV